MDPGVADSLLEGDDLELLLVLALGGVHLAPLGVPQLVLLGQGRVLGVTDGSPGEASSGLHPEAVTAALALESGDAVLTVEHQDGQVGGTDGTPLPLLANGLLLHPETSLRSTC